MTPVYTVSIDQGDDGGYSAEISADVLALSWRLGMDRPYDPIAAASEARITVQNRDRAYSPEAAPDLLRIGRRARIQCDDGGVIRTLFTGFISRVEPQPGDLSAREAVIVLTGPEPELARTPVLLPLRTDVRAETVIAAVLDTPPLDRSPRALETGLTRFAYVGDDWGGGIAALQAIREVVEGERGRFFTARDGTLTFINRHHTLRPGPDAAVFSDDMAGLRYDFGAQVVNTVQVALRPRSLGSAGAVLWTLAAPQLIRPGDAGEREIIARLRDSAGNPMGATDMIAPVSGVDFTANTARDGSGQDVTGDFSLTLAGIEGSAARLRVRNNGATAAYLLAGARLRGTALTGGDRLLVAQQDSASMADHGARGLTLDLPALDSVEDADQLARFELARRVQPRGQVQSMTLDRRRHPAALALSLFDRVRITESQSGHSGPYFIVAEQHTVTTGGTRHEITWRLEPADLPLYWSLDAQGLDTATRLAY